MKRSSPYKKQSIRTQGGERKKEGEEPHPFSKSLLLLRVGSIDDAQKGFEKKFKDVQYKLHCTTAPLHHLTNMFM